MATFRFTVQDMYGKRTSGTLHALDRDAAMKTLTGKNFFVTRLIEENEANSKFWTRLFENHGGVKGDELLVFTQEMSMLLEAGIPLKRILEAMAQESPSVPLRRVAIEISSGLSYGSSIAELFAKHPKIFSKLYLSMVTIGQNSGRLPEILKTLAGYIEEAESLKKKAKTALYYPLIVLLCLAALLWGALAFGVPMMAGMYQQFGADLPWPTRLLLKLSHFASRDGWVALLLLGAAAAGFFRIRQNKKASEVIDRLKLKIPILGKIFQQLAITHASKALGTVLGSGIPLLAGLDLVAESIENKAMKEVIEAVIKNARQGESLSAPFRSSRLFTPISISMISVGETSGSLDAMFNKLSEYYNAELKISLRALVALVEPLTVILVGLAVAAMIIALGLPFLNLSRLIQVG